MADVLITALNGQSIWTILAVFLILYVIKDSRERENKLMTHIERLDDSQNKIVNRLEKIEEKIK